MGSASAFVRLGFVVLAVVAGVEWLLGRAISRIAASPALEGTPREFIEGLGAVGLFLVAPASLLAAALYLTLCVFAGADAIRRKDSNGLALAMFLALFGVVSAAYAFLPQAPWSGLTYTLLALCAIGWLTIFSGVSQQGSARIGIMLVGTAYIGYLLYLLLEQLGRNGAVVQISPTMIRDIGEIAAVSAPFAFFTAAAVPHGEWKRVRRWVLPVLLATALGVGTTVDIAADQGFTGVFAIWSTGFTFFLPWPLYAISLALFTFTVLTCFSRAPSHAGFATPTRGIGLLLLVFAQYELQFPYQYLLALLSLMLIGGFAPGLGDEGLTESKPLTIESRVDIVSQPKSASEGPPAGHAI